MSKFFTKSKICSNSSQSRFVPILHSIAKFEFEYHHHHHQFQNCKVVKNQSKFFPESSQAFKICVNQLLHYLIIQLPNYPIFQCECEVESIIVNMFDFIINPYRRIIPKKFSKSCAIDHIIPSSFQLQVSYLQKIFVQL